MENPNTNHLGFLYDGLEHGKETLLKHFDKTCEDGQSVDVYVTATPARFYRIDALPSKNSVGYDVPPFSLSTGSGMEKLALDIAGAASGGMIGIAD